MQLWQARQVHGLVEAQGHMTAAPRRAGLVAAMRHIIEEMDGGLGAHFARRVGVTKSTAHYWLQGDKTPTLETTMGVASQSGIALADLLQGNTSGWKPPSTAQQLTLAFAKPEVRPRAVPRDIDWHEVHRQLQAFLKLPTPISVHEAARRLHMGSSQLYLNVN